MDNVRGQDVETDEAYDYGAIEAPPVISSGERRMHVRAYNYWVSLLGKRRLPSIEDLNPEQLDEFSPHSVLLDFSLGVENPAIVYLGSALREQCDIKGPIDRIADVPPRSLLSRLTDHYLQIIANAAPVGFEAEFVNQRGSEILYRGILMPFSSDDQTIDFIYGVINWKEAAAPALADALGEQMLAALQAPAPSYPAAPIWAEGPSATADFEDEDAAPETAQPAVAADPAELDLSAFLAPDQDFADPDAAPDADADSLPLLSEDSLIDLTAIAPPTAGETGDADEEAHPDAGREPDLAEDRADMAAPVSGYNDGDADADAAPDADAATPPPGADTPAAAVDTIDTDTDTDTDTDSDTDADEGPAPEAGLSADPLTERLHEARLCADEARDVDSRSRAALYRAIGEAYDFALSAGEAPEAYAALLAETGIAVQERSPMTAVIKLVFGLDYDKTRIAEYALVLDHALSAGLPRGSLSTFIFAQIGGLKGMVKAIREERRLGKGLRTSQRLDKAVARLSRAAPAAPETLPFDAHGLALVVARREDDGRITLVAGLSPEDRAAQKALIAAGKSLTEPDDDEKAAPED